MKLTLTNLAPIGVPVTSTDGEGFVHTLDSHQTATLDRPESVWIIGDKPGQLEQIEKAFKTLAMALKAFLVHKSKVAQGGALALEIVIANDGDKSVRVIPGEVEHEANLAPGVTQTFNAVDYVEVRELGA